MIDEGLTENSWFIHQEVQEKTTLGVLLRITTVNKLEVKWIYEIYTLH